MLLKQEKWVYNILMAVILNEKNLSKIIRETRKAAKLSQLELAELSGVGKTLIFNLEKGHTQIHFDNLLKVLKVLNIKLQAELPL
ncbi:MAG: helix-turn-helix transcriptional regulator [Bdellovibrionales bacterium]|nr:helix-turn-helix transcriptional regulator [Bdellovibrionales bacterium]